MSGLPRGWAKLRLGEIATRSSSVDPSRTPQETFELYSVPSFETGAPDIIQGDQIKSSKQAVEPDDVLLCKIVPHINRVWTVGPKRGLRQIASGEWIVYRNHGCEPRYLRYCLSEGSFREQFLATVSGVGGSLMRARPSAVAEIEVPIAPLPEQRRIVGKIGSLSAKSSRARAHLDYIPRLVEKYKQSLLAAAFRGELTREWRNSSRALSAGATPMAQPTQTQRRRRMPTSGFTNRIGVDFPEVPAGWRYKTVGSLVEGGALIDFADGNHGSDYPRKSEFGTEGAIFLTAAQIRNGHAHFGECPLLNWDKAKTLRKGWANTGDVLLTHNATVGRVAIVEEQVAPFLLGTSVTYYRPNQALLLSRYLYWGLCSPVFQGQLHAIMGQTTRNQVPITRQAHIELPIAPLAEQQEIVHGIDSALRWIDRLSGEAGSARKLIDHLDQAVLAKAFRGELVPQDPTDEPATALLERIRAERQSTTVGRQRVGQRS